MKNKTILITVISVVVAILAIVILVVSLRKKPAAVVQVPSTTTGTGTVSNGASPDLAVVGSGVVNVIAPKSNPTQPYSTTAPRVEPVSQGNGSSVALQPATGSSQQTATTGQVAYNYNQSDDDFLNQYYPDAQQVISGNEGPAGNAGQDPANQVLYTTGPATPTGPDLTLPDGFDISTLQTSNDNSVGNIQAYLTALAAATAPFDVVNNSSLVTAPLQNMDSNAATSNGQQAAAVLQAVQALVVPSSIVDLQASYVDTYEQYVTYSGQLTSFLNSSASTISSQEGAIEGTVGTLSTVINIASTNYKNTVAFYGTGSGSGTSESGTTLPVNTPNPVVPGGPIQSGTGGVTGSTGGSDGSGGGSTKETATQ